MDERVSPGEHLPQAAGSLPAAQAKMPKRPSGKRVLILMSDTGGGHRSAAEAISAGLHRVHGERFQVFVVDALAQSLPPPLNRIGEMYSPIIHRAPWAWGQFYRLSNSPGKVSAVVSVLYPSVRDGFEALIREINPHLIVSAHPFLNHVPSRVSRERFNAIPVVTLVTDPVTVHAAWVCPDADLCLVATQEAARRTIALGMAPEKVRVTGLPIDPRFEECGGTDRVALRRKWGLPVDLPLALVMGGGEGAGELYELVSALEQARVPAALVVVTGRNRALLRRLEMRAWEMEVRVLGFVREMPELMGASNLVLTKAGPATLWEAMGAGLPIVMTGYVPGQEEGNAAFVQGAGAGCLVSDPREVAESLLAWFRPEDDTLARMADNSRALARPRAALEIADLLAGLIG